MSSQIKGDNEPRGHLLIRFVSLPLLEGRRPTYPVSAQLSMSDLSIAPASALGDDEPEDMVAAGLASKSGL